MTLYMSSLAKLSSFSTFYNSQNYVKDLTVMEPTVLNGRKAYIGMAFRKGHPKTLYTLLSEGCTCLQREASDLY